MTTPGLAPLFRDSRLPTTSERPPMDKWFAIMMIGIVLAMCLPASVKIYSQGQVAASCNNLQAMAIAMSVQPPKCVKP